METKLSPDEVVKMVRSGWHVTECKKCGTNNIHRNHDPICSKCKEKLYEPQKLNLFSYFLLIVISPIILPFIIWDYTRGKKNA